MAVARLRTIRGQLIASLVLFELLALIFFSAVLLHERNEEAHQRMLRRLEYQASELEVVTRLALQDNNLQMMHTVVQSMLQFPTIAAVRVSDPSGHTMAASDARTASDAGAPGGALLSEWERTQLLSVHSLLVARSPSGAVEAFMPVTVHGRVAAFVILFPRDASYSNAVGELLRVSAWGTAAVLLACTMLAALIARSLTRPLVRLMAATRQLIINPEDTSAFPLPVQGQNEAADLTIAFNLMVAAMEEQRRGLGDTLALLDSMLANAPIGIAFFDRNGRFVRVNHFLAAESLSESSHYLGRRIDEVFTPEAGRPLSAAVEDVFANGTTLQELEIAAIDLLQPDGALQGKSSASRRWLVNVYPVRTTAQTIRWAGVVFVDITERLRSEQTLRDTEKLVAVGRLASSIAHEINNPLEAVTNLLYLLQNHGTLGEEERRWTESAQHEVERVSAITQQTLRFHRQSTRPEQTSLAELLDSVLTLYQGRVTTLQVMLIKRYRAAGDLSCFAGEIRQLFANLIGNALDAMQPSGGNLVLEVRESCSWRDTSICGVRVTVADTGCGMSAQVRKRIFEPFYTTKEATGTGLGLWVGAEIMSKHQVSLRIRSRERMAGFPDKAPNGTLDGAASHHGRSPGRPHGTVFMLFFPSVLTTASDGLVAVEAQTAH
jgi:signal transduction histidine kinase